MIETLKEVRRKEEDLKSLENIKLELKKSKEEIKRLNESIKWNQKHINILSRTLWEKICPDCWWEWWFEWYEWDWWPCETCKTSWIIPINQ